MELRLNSAARPLPTLGVRTSRKVIGHELDTPNHQPHKGRISGGIQLSPQEGPPSMPKSLLVADDSLTIRKVIGMILATENFQITSLDNCPKAITKTQT